MVARTELAGSWGAKGIQLLAGSVPELLLRVTAKEEQVPSRLISRF